MNENKVNNWLYSDIDELIDFDYDEVALDIHGKEIDSSYMLPLFIEKGKSEDKYDKIMMDQLEKIRRGF